MGKNIKIGSLSVPGFKFNFKGEGEVFEEAVALMKQIFEEKACAVEPCGEYEILLTICDEDIKKEGYIIDITEEKAVLKAADAAGAYYAAATFEQIIHREGTEVFLPLCHIEDYPKFEKRGHFMECRYGSDFMTFEDWKKGIDYLSKMKVNKIIVGLYGCWGHHYDNRFAEYLYYPFKKHPELKTPRHIKYYSAKEGKMVYKKDVLPTMFEDDYFGKLVAYGKRKNIEIIPLVSVVGVHTGLGCQALQTFKML
jgi:N-acetyl-beta-hexosaminidase